MTGRQVIGVVVLVLLVLGAVRFFENTTSRGDPPVACQQFGGNWTLWGGWSCG